MICVAAYPRSRHHLIDCLTQRKKHGKVTNDALRFPMSEKKALWPLLSTTRKVNSSGPSILLQREVRLAQSQKRSLRQASCEKLLKQEDPGNQMKNWR